MEHEAAYWINHLQLTSHVEGGFYKEIYRSSLSIPGTCLPARFKAARAISTSIYFLLENDQFSALHRIASDEVWHFYTGDCLVIYELEPGGRLVEHKLGNQPQEGQVFQVTIEAGNWFAARLEQGGKFSLVGCTVSPGFEFADFEMANRSELSSQFPQHRILIESLTR